MKQKLWKAIEAYRMSGGREEHWRNRDVLDILLDVVPEENARVLAANRDVMLHFDALKQDYDMLVKQSQEPVTRISVQDALPKAVRGVSYNARLTDEWCDHSWSYEGHSHNDSFYVCTHCKKEEWR